MHDRVDIATTMLGYTMAALWSKGRHRVEEFMPPWLREVVRETERGQRSDDQVIAALETWFALAEGGSDADD